MLPGAAAHCGSLGFKPHKGNPHSLAVRKDCGEALVISASLRREAAWIVQLNLLQKKASLYLIRCIWCAPQLQCLARGLAWLTAAPAQMRACFTALLLIAHGVRPCIPRVCLHAEAGCTPQLAASVSPCKHCSNVARIGTQLPYLSVLNSVLDSVLVGTRLGTSRY